MLLAQPLRAFELGKQQRVGERLRVGVGELRVVGFGEEDVAPVLGEVVQGGVIPADGALHLVAEDARVGRDELGQLARISGRDGLPGEEVDEQLLELGQRVGLKRGSAAGGEVVGDPDVRLQLALAVEAPLLAVGVDQVGQRAEAPPLAAVGAVRRELVGPRTKPGRFQLDVARQQPTDGDAEVGPPDVFDAHLWAVVDLAVGEASEGGEQLADGRFERLFGLPADA